MSNKHFEAADALRRAAKLLESFKLAHDAMESIGSIEQAAKEAEARAVKAKAEFESWQKELEEARIAVRLERGKVKKAEEDAKVKADAILADAKEKADTLTVNAMAAADAAAAAMTKAAEDRKVKLQDELAALSAEVASLSKDRLSLSAEIKDLSASKAKLEAAIESLKAKFA
jgi:predicted  nucleic acid-binding Zn-ribbon protein